MTTSTGAGAGAKHTATASPISAPTTSRQLRSQAEAAAVETVEADPIARWQEPDEWQPFNDDDAPDRDDTPEELPLEADDDRDDEQGDTVDLVDTPSTAFPYPKITISTVGGIPTVHVHPASPAFLTDPILADKASSYQRWLENVGDWLCTEQADACRASTMNEFVERLSSISKTDAAGNTGSLEGVATQLSRRRNVVVGFPAGVVPLDIFFLTGGKSGDQPLRIARAVARHPNTRDSNTDNVDISRALADQFSSHSAVEKYVRLVRAALSENGYAVVRHYRMVFAATADLAVRDLLRKQLQRATGRNFTGSRGATVINLALIGALVPPLDAA